MSKKKKSLVENLVDAVMGESDVPAPEAEAAEEVVEAKAPKAKSKQPKKSDQVPPKYKKFL
jgi:hypothetical protein